MEFWTVMWISVLGGDFDNMTSAIAYPSLDACEAALAPVSGTLPYDHNMICEETATPSASIRPMPRPEGLTE
jgi:hypothetical protein